MDANSFFYYEIACLLALPFIKRYAAVVISEQSNIILYKKNIYKIIKYGIIG